MLESSAHPAEPYGAAATAPLTLPSTGITEWPGRKGARCDLLQADGRSHSLTRSLSLPLPSPGKRLSFSPKSFHKRCRTLSRSFHTILTVTSFMMNSLKRVHNGIDCSHSDRADSRAAASVRDAERLVQVEVGHVAAVVARAAQADLQYG